MTCSHPYQLGDEPVPGYRLVKFLGRGGFGEVWKAAAPGGAAVALKVIVNLSGAEGRKELRALSIVKRIQHAHLVPVSAVWLKDGEGNLLDETFASEEERILNNPARNPVDSNSETMVIPPGHTEPRSAELLIAMGLGHKSLFDRLQECKRQGLDGIPPAELLDYMEQAARAIDYLNGANHELGKGIVAVQHCDIKPHNILIVGTAVQVCDFGLARVRGDVRATASTGASVAYASPECLEAEGRPSEATDQYSLGISYYEMRTGLLPYRDTSFAKVMQAVLTGNLELSKLAPAEQKVIRRATARDPAQRFPSAMVMVKALRKAVEGPDQYEPSRRRTWPKVLAAAVLLFAVASGAIWYGRDWLGLEDVLAGWTAGINGNTTTGPAADELLTEAEQAVASGDSSRAAELYTKALSKDPRLAGALVGRGRLRLGQGDFDAALADLAKAREIDHAAVSGADEARALNGRALQYLAQKKYSDALDDFSAAERLDATVVHRSSMGKAYQARGILRQDERMFGDAIADFTAAMEKSPELDRDAHVRRAECRLETGDPQGAAQDAEAAINSDPEFVEAYFVRGRAKAASKDNVGAAVDFARVGELSKDFYRDRDRAKVAATVYHVVGTQALAAKDLDKALSEFELAASLDTDGALGFKSNVEFASVYVQRAAKLREGGNLDEAIANCSRAIKDHPQFASAAHSERGECYYEQGKLADAVTDLTMAIGLDPKNVLAYGRRGLAHMQLEKYDEALKDLDEAIRLTGEYDDRFNRAIVLSTLRRFPEAEKAFGELIDERPADPDAFYQRAIVALDLQDYDRAIGDLRSARKLLDAAAAKQGPDADVARSKLGDTLALLGWVQACRPGSDRKSADEAVRDINTACVNSNWAVPWHIDALAAAYASQGNFGKAQEWQEQAIKRATHGEATPPMAPARRELEALYRSERAFRLPSDAPSTASPKSADKRPQSNSKLKPEVLTPSKAPANNPAAKRPAATPKQVLEDAEKILQGVKPNPPPKP